MTTTLPRTRLNDKQEPQPQQEQCYCPRQEKKTTTERQLTTPRRLAARHHSQCTEGAGEPVGVVPQHAEHDPRPTTVTPTHDHQSFGCSDCRCSPCYRQAASPPYPHERTAIRRG